MNKYTTGQTLKTTRVISYMRDGTWYKIEEGTEVTYEEDWATERPYAQLDHVVTHHRADGDSRVLVYGNEVEAA